LSNHNHCGSEVLILGGDLAQAEETACYLTSHGCRADAFVDKHALLSRIDDAAPRLVLLQAAGASPEALVDIVSEIRTHAPLPCILHAQAPDLLAQRVHGLENGVDDWIPVETKPREVLARIRAVLRRCRRQEPANPSPPLASAAVTPAPPKVLTWKFSPEHRELFTPNGSPCLLTSAEFDLLLPLILNQGVAVERELLSQAVFRRSYNPDDRGLDNLVARLRRKLSAHSKNPRIIKAVRGIGYLFTSF
jgi:DNA-binding response OmpR family regulator